METSVQNVGKVAESVRRTITRLPRGRVFSTDHICKSESNRNTVLRILSRLFEEGLICRIQNGVYYKPETSKILRGKTLPPDINQTIRVITAKNKETIQLHGGIAVNRLGISTQMPVHKVFHTDGISREIQIAGTTVKFIHTNNQKLLQYSDTPIGLAISAMFYLGKELVTEEVVQKIKVFLTEEEFRQLNNAKLTAWMSAALKSEPHYV